MLQRILTGFTALPGAEQAYLVSRRDGLVAAVGKRNQVPQVDDTTQLIQMMESLEEHLGLGRSLEFWSEGTETMLISRISEDTSIVLTGKKGDRIARWRHAIENDVEMISALMR